jgi:hypothetical protein
VATSESGDARGTHAGLPGVTFYCDGGGRHLVCVPYTVANLHAMARVLGIGRHWFHAGRLAHYDVPKRRVQELTERAVCINSRQVLRIIKGLAFDDRTR